MKASAANRGKRAAWAKDPSATSVGSKHMKCNGSVYVCGACGVNSKDEPDWAHRKANGDPDRAACGGCFRKYLKHMRFVPSFEALCENFVESPTLKTSFLNADAVEAGTKPKDFCESDVITQKGNMFIIEKSGPWLSEAQVKTDCGQTAKRLKLKPIEETIDGVVEKGYPFKDEYTGWRWRYMKFSGNVQDTFQLTRDKHVMDKQAEMLFANAVGGRRAASGEAAILESAHLPDWAATVERGRRAAKGSAADDDADESEDASATSTCVVASAAVGPTFYPMAPPSGRIVRKPTLEKMDSPTKSLPATDLDALETCSTASPTSSTMNVCSETGSVVSGLTGLDGADRTVMLKCPKAIPGKVDYWIQENALFRIMSDEALGLAKVQGELLLQKISASQSLKQQYKSEFDRLKLHMENAAHARKVRLENTVVCDKGYDDAIAAIVALGEKLPAKVQVGNLRRQLRKKMPTGMTSLALAGKAAILDYIVRTKGWLSTNAVEEDMQLDEAETFSSYKSTDPHVRDMEVSTCTKASLFIELFFVELVAVGIELGEGPKDALKVIIGVALEHLESDAANDSCPDDFTDSHYDALVTEQIKEFIYSRYPFWSFTFIELHNFGSGPSNS